MSDPRKELARARVVVVKIGSKTLAGSDRIYETLAQDLKVARDRGVRVVIVSSGAIALGVKKLGYRGRPKEMARLQAAAAAGQSLLMRAYEEAFSAHGLVVAQVLLSHADLADRTRGNNARAALSALLDQGAIPILNENDSVAVDEIKFGDNDQLSSMVTPLVDATALLLLSDVDGLLDAKGRRVRAVKDIATEAVPLVQSSKSDVGTGGMGSKVEAARRATLAGAHVVIADARVPGIVGRVLSGEDVGTVFVPPERRLSAKKHWIAFTLRPRGDLILDAGCVTAVRDRGKSVLTIGILGVRGAFNPGDSVRLLDAAGTELGRGLARLGTPDCARLAHRDEESTVAVHRDEMVIW